MQKWAKVLLLVWTVKFFSDWGDVVKFLDTLPPEIAQNAKIGQTLSNINVPGCYVIYQEVGTKDGVKSKLDRH